MTSAYMRTAQANFDTTCYLKELEANAEAIYWAQQAAEKSWKAWLILERGQTQFGHKTNFINLDILANYTSADDATELRNIEAGLKYLNQLANDQNVTRYPTLVYSTITEPPSSFENSEARQAIVASAFICQGFTLFIKKRTWQIYSTPHEAAQQLLALLLPFKDTALERLRLHYSKK